MERRVSATGGEMLVVKNGAGCHSWFPVTSQQDVPEL
jgi:hypothetical protein